MAQFEVLILLTLFVFRKCSIHVKVGPLLSEKIRCKKHSHWGREK